MISVGITGGVGAGKSAIIEYLRENTNCEILFADRYAEELEKRGNVCYEPLIELLGEDILGEDLEIDRGKMAAKMFGDPILTQGVNDIVHPAVK